MKMYKGFNKDLQCTPGGKVFQYEIGKTYETDNADMCNEGFHACESPLDVLNYYPPTNSRYCEVELDDVTDQHGDDSKRCGKKITVGAEIGIPGLVKAHVEYVNERIHSKATKRNTGYRSASTNTGNWSAATNTGDQSAATNTGNWSAATNTGYRSASTNTGDQSAATNTGDQSAATNTGDWSAATNTGDWSAATNTGNWSAATNTGNWSAATNTGNWSAASVTGEGSVAIVTGIGSRAKASSGSAIVICERGEWNGKCCPILSIKSGIVDGITIKPDTWYTLKDGEFVEVSE